MANWLDIRFVADPLDIAAAIAQVNADGVGGVDLFLGITRAEQSPELGALTHLDYHAYEEMALAQMHRMVIQAGQQWTITRAVVWHRLGPVAVGEGSVLIAVASPHRNDAFAACRHIIDELKKLAPIWKREVYERDARWQAPSSP